MEILPLILRQFVDDFQEKIPGRFVLLNPPVSVSNDETISDHHMYHVLHMLVKIASICPNFLKNQQYLDYIETIGGITYFFLKKKKKVQIILNNVYTILFILQTVRKVYLGMLTNGFAKLQYNC